MTLCRAAQANKNDVGNGGQAFPLTGPSVAASYRIDTPIKLRARHLRVRTLVPSRRCGRVLVSCASQCRASFAPASRLRKENAGKRELPVALFVVFVSCSFWRESFGRTRGHPSTQDARPERAMLAVASRVRSVSLQVDVRPSTAGAGPAVQFGKG